MAATTSQLFIGLFEGYGEGITPTPDFTPQSGFPASHMGGSLLFDRVRSPAADLDVSFDWDLGAARNIRAALIPSSNLTSAAQHRLILASNSGMSNDVVQSGGALADLYDNTLGTAMTVVPPWGRSLLYIFDDAYSRRYARWRVADTANPDNYLEFGPARFGDGLQLSFRDWRKQPTFVGPIGSQKVVRRHEFTLHNLTRTEAYNLESVLLAVKNVRRVLIVPEPLAEDTFIHDVLWATVENVYSRQSLLNTDYNDRRFEIVLTVREAEY